MASWNWYLNFNITSTEQLHQPWLEHFPSAIDQPRGKITIVYINMARLIRTDAASQSSVASICANKLYIMFFEPNLFAGIARLQHYVVKLCIPLSTTLRHWQCSMQHYIHYINDKAPSQDSCPCHYTCFYPKQCILYADKLWTDTTNWHYMSWGIQTSLSVWITTNKNHILHVTDNSIVRRTPKFGYHWLNFFHLTLKSQSKNRLKLEQVQFYETHQLKSCWSQVKPATQPASVSHVHVLDPHKL